MRVCMCVVSLSFSLCLFVVLLLPLAIVAMGTAVHGSFLILEMPLRFQGLRNHEEDI